MSVINTNYLALVSQNNLTKSQNALGSAIERLSSGLRINSAKDDAAGQAIANRFTANIKGLTQASRNANDGISIAQTTEGALNEINNNLQRIRELSVQAATGSNSPSDLKSIQDEVQQRLEEIDRVSKQTQFNSVQVLAKDNTLTIQVGAHDSETISINLKAITSDTLGLGKLDLQNQVVSKDDLGESNFTTVTTAKGAVDAKWTAFTPTTTGAATYTLEVGTDNKLYATDGTTAYNATYDADDDKIILGTTVATNSYTEAAGATEFDNGAGGVVSLADVDASKIDTTPPGVEDVYQVNQSTGATTYYVKGDDGNYYDATLDADTGDLEIDLATGSTVAPSGASAGVTVSAEQVLTQLAQPGVDVDLSDLDLGGGTNSLVQHKNGNYYVQNVNDGVTTYYAASAPDATTGKVTVGADAEVVIDPLSAIDTALAQVDSLRSELGAIQNRFQSTIANLANTVNNLSAARSRIEDADYAVEVSNMTRAQILQQAGTSVLAQANQVPQTVLSLLR
ncbi:flagellin [Pollutimonas sp. M17]|uniref:flagellin N-terminal helical domain-containing protein n=1 Tax=Pollutimonas sp. M17 TaxID=2962065 RepID=UPI0021F4F048|nr:flagellin [Pollutimonas sp. M17]UYO94992.1 flagellin [Pollutimonas sp. M17]